MNDYLSMFDWLRGDNYAVGGVGPGGSFANTGVMDAVAKTNNYDPWDFFNNQEGGQGGAFGNIGGFNSMLNFGKLGFGIYGGLKQLGMAQDQFDEQKKYASANYYNQRVLTDERRQKQAASLASAQGRPVSRPYLTNPQKLRKLS